MRSRISTRGSVCPSVSLSVHLSITSYFKIRKMEVLILVYYQEGPGKGVFGGPSGPSREGPGVGHKIVSDTKQMTKEREKKEKN